MPLASPSAPAKSAAGTKTPLRVAAAPKKKPFRGLGAKKKNRIDIPFLTLTIILLLFGLVMLFSASYPTGYIRFGDSMAFILPQLRFAVLGVIVMIVASLIDYHILKKFAWPLMFLALVLLVVVLFMEDGKSFHRWITIGSLGFQPSEIAKFAVILLFAALIAANQNRIKTFQYGFFPFVLILGIVSFLLIKEPHLSCTVLVLGIGIIMMFAGGTSVKWFVGGAILIAVALYFTLTQFPDLVPYAQDRIDIWRDPFGADKDDAHQVIQSMIAVGSGGLTGAGIGGSVQKFLYLPEMYNDYIFAIVCEELGFIGAVALVVLFLLLLLRGLIIAIRAKDKFGSMLAVGISAQIALQTFLHVGVNINAIPSTGISLPFFSSGGSSLVMLLAQVGVILSVSRQMRATIAKPEEEDESPAAAQADEAAASG